MANIMSNSMNRYKANNHYKIIREKTPKQVCPCGSGKSIAGVVSHRIGSRNLRREASRMADANAKKRVAWLIENYERTKVQVDDFALKYGKKPAYVLFTPDDMIYLGDQLEPIIKFLRKTYDGEPWIDNECRLMLLDDDCVVLIMTTDGFTRTNWTNATRHYQSSIGHDTKPGNRVLDPVLGSGSLVSDRIRNFMKGNNE